LIGKLPQEVDIRGVSGPTNDAPLTDDELAALDHLAERIVTIAGKLLSQ
jgi:hypothetical protein